MCVVKGPMALQKNITCSLTLSDLVENQLIPAYKVTTYGRVITYKKDSLVAGLVSDIVIQRSICSPTHIQYCALNGNFLRKRTNNGVVFVVHHCSLMDDCHTATNWLLFFLWPVNYGCKKKTSFVVPSFATSYSLSNYFTALRWSPGT